MFGRSNGPAVITSSFRLESTVTVTLGSGTGRIVSVARAARGSRPTPTWVTPRRGPRTADGEHCATGDRHPTCCAAEAFARRRRPQHLRAGKQCQAGSDESGGARGRFSWLAGPLAAQGRVFPDVPSFERPEASPRVHGIAGRIISARRGDSRFGSEAEAEVALGENFPVVALRRGARSHHPGSRLAGLCPVQPRATRRAR